MRMQLSELEPAFRGLTPQQIERAMAKTSPSNRKGGSGVRGALGVAAYLSTLCGAFGDSRLDAESKAHFEKRLRNTYRAAHDKYAVG